MIVIATPVPAFYLRGRGYDINRYHPFRPECPVDNPNWPNVTTGVTSCETVDYAPGDDYDITLGNPVPEAKTIRALSTNSIPPSSWTSTTRARSPTTTAE